MLKFQIILISLGLSIGLNSLSAQEIQSEPKVRKKTTKYKAYLFTYFTGNSGEEEAIRFAVSNDGYNFKALNKNKPIINSKVISSTGGVRDPHILRGTDGKTFYMVATDMVSASGWDSNRGIVLMKSTNLIDWTSYAINFQKRFTGNEKLKRVWAPQTIFDTSVGKYMVYYSLKYAGEPDRIYYSYVNSTFSDLETEPKQLFFSPTNSACIDADIINKDGKYYLFFKGESGNPGIKLAVSDSLTKGYGLVVEAVQQTSELVEGAAVFKLNHGKGYVLMYDRYTTGKYQFTFSTDLQNFKIIDNEISMNFHPRHGTVLPITKAEIKRLVKKWGE